MRTRELIKRLKLKPPTRTKERLVLKPYDVKELETVPYVGSVAQNYEAILHQKQRHIHRHMEAQILTESVLAEAKETPHEQILERLRRVAGAGAVAKLEGIGIQFVDWDHIFSKLSAWDRIYIQGKLFQIQDV